MLKLNKFGAKGNWSQIYNHNVNTDLIFWANGQAGIDELFSDVGNLPTDQKYSRMGNLSDYEDSSGITIFKMRFPDEDLDIVWEQSIPITSPNNTFDPRFKLLSFPAGKDTSRFGPLTLSSSSTSAFDSCTFSSNWFFPIGTNIVYAGGIPAFQPGDPVATYNIELYVMNDSALLSESGCKHVAILSPSADSDSNFNAIIKVDDFIKKSLYNVSYMLIVVDSLTNVITKNVEYNSLAPIAPELNNLGPGQTLFFVSTKSVTSNADLDDVLINKFNSIHWKSTEIYENSRESFSYAAIISTDTGIIREELGIIKAVDLEFTYGTTEGLTDMGYGSTLITYPWHNTSYTTYTGLIDFDYVNISATGKLISNTDQLLTVRFKNASGGIITISELKFDNTLLNKYEEKVIWAQVPNGTTSIDYIIGSGLLLSGMRIVKATSGDNLQTSSYNFDGIDDYIKIPVVNMIAGDTIEFDFYITEWSNIHRFIFSDDREDTSNIYIRSTDNFLRAGYNSYNLVVNGNDIGFDGAIELNKVNHVVATCNKNIQLGLIGKLVNGNGNNINFPVYNIKINTTSDKREYRINEGPYNKPYIKDSLGTAISQYELSGINGNKDYYEIPPVQLSIDDTISVEVYIKESSETTQLLLDGRTFRPDSGYIEFKLTNDDLKIKPIGYDNITVNGVLNIDNNFNFEYNTWYTITARVSSNNTAINTIGKYSIFNYYFNGTIKNLSIELINEPSLSRFYPLNDGKGSATILDELNPELRHYYYMDGTSDYISIPPIDMNNVRVTGTVFIDPEVNSQVIILGGDGFVGCQLSWYPSGDNDGLGYIRGYNMSDWGGEAISCAVGTWVDFDLSYTGTDVINKIGAREIAGNTQLYFKGVIKDINFRTIDGVPLRNYPINDRWDFNPIIRDIDDTTYKFNGINNYITIPTVNLVAGDVVEFKYFSTDISSTNAKFLDGTIDGVDRFTIAKTTGGQMVLNGVNTITVDGKTLTTFPENDSIEHTVIATVSKSCKIGVIGAYYNLDQDFSNNNIYDVQIRSVNGDRTYPIEDGFNQEQLIEQSIPHGYNTNNTVTFNEKFNIFLDYNADIDPKYGNISPNDQESHLRAKGEHRWNDTEISNSTNAVVEYDTKTLITDTNAQGMTLINCPINRNILKFNVTSSGNVTYQIRDGVNNGSAPLLGTITLLANIPTEINFKMINRTTNNIYIRSITNGIIKSSFSYIDVVDENDSIITPDIKTVNNGLSNEFTENNWEFNNGTAQTFSELNWEYESVTDGNIINLNPNNWKYKSPTDGISYNFDDENWSTNAGGLQLSKYGIANESILQNNIPASLLNNISYNTVYNSSVNMLNTIDEDATIDILTAGSSLTFDVTDLIENRNNDDITLHTPLYICYWVYGESDLTISSNDNVLIDPYNNINTLSSASIAGSDGLESHWQLVEGFIFPYDYDVNKCTEYLKHFKDNGIVNEFTNNTLFANKIGNDYRYAVVLNDNGNQLDDNGLDSYHNSQNVSINITNTSDSNIQVYGAICTRSSTLSANNKYNISIVNL